MSAPRALTMESSGSKDDSATLFPIKADASYASSQTASLLHDYFTARSKHDADAWVSFFDPSSTLYLDASLGGGATDYSAWIALAKHFANIWGDGAISYPVRILGDMEHGAVVYSVDAAPVFGEELRILSAIDFLGGKIIRQIDYWDGRGTALIKTRVPNDQYDKTLGQSRASELASSKMQKVSRQLQAHLSANDYTAAAQLFSIEGIFEDLALRTRVEGRSGIKGYLQRILPTAPYGQGATVRHVLGSDCAGGYEWVIGADSKLDVLNGITALELDESESITRLTVVWESSRVENTTMALLTNAAIPPQAG